MATVPQDEASQHTETKTHNTEVNESLTRNAVALRYFPSQRHVKDRLNMQHLILSERIF